MNRILLRRLALVTAISTLSMAALLGILALLTGSLDGVGGRVLATTAVIGASAVLCLCYLAPAGARTWWVGALGAAVMVVPTSLLLLFVWLPDMSSGWFDATHKPLLIGIDGSLTLAQISLLIGATRDRVRELLWCTVGVAALLAAMIAVPIALDHGPSAAVARLYGIVGILDALGTIVVLILARFGSRVGVVTVSLPADLIAQVDALVGPSERAAYVASAVSQHLAGTVVGCD